MTEHHDLDRQLNAFLLDGPTSLPDSSFDAVRDRTEQTRQRVVLGPWRVPTLNKLIPIGLGAAALVVALLLGSRFIGSPSSNVGGPADQPTATAEPSLRAPASAAPEGPSPPGVTDASRADHRHRAAPRGGPRARTMCWGTHRLRRGADRLRGREYYVYGDACHYTTTKPATPATTVDEFVDALANQASREASAPEDITVDGYAGKKIILHQADDVDITTCDEGGDSLTMFGSPGADRGGTPSGHDRGGVPWTWTAARGPQWRTTRSPQNGVDEVRAIVSHPAAFD